jgi:hypothetical protein
MKRLILIVNVLVTFLMSGLLTLTVASFAYRGDLGTVLTTVTMTLGLACTAWTMAGWMLFRWVARRLEDGGVQLQPRMRFAKAIDAWLRPQG